MNELMSDENLRKLHNVEIEILDEVVRICEKYNLTYFLTGGTLLGAVRHKGFIPWDDDLDIGMPRKDYEKFINIYANELNDIYMIDNKNTNPKYYLNFTKIRKKNTIFEQEFQVNYDGPKGIWIDLFPFDNAKSDNSKIIAIQYKINKLIFSILHYKNKFFLNKNKLIIKRIIGILFKPISNKTLLNLQDKVMKWNFKKDDYKYFVALSTAYNYKSELIKKEKYLPTIKMKFENKEYNVPKEYDFILHSMYGNYMEIPPIEKRVTHNPVNLKF